MTIDFYYIPGSSPCRAVLLTAKALGLDLNLKLTDLMKGEHMTPEFVKMNPQHLVPTLNDNGFVLWESRAICSYLAEKYGKDDSLYPKDVQKRALVNQRLYFDAGTLYQRFGDYVYPHYFGGAPLSADNLKKLDDALEFLNIFLEGNEWVAGDHLTIADLSILASISTMDIVDIDLSKYANVTRWFENAKKTAKGYEVNQEGCLKFKAMADHLTGKA